MITTEFLQSVMNGDEDAIQSLIRANQRQVFQLALSILDTAADDPTEAAAQAEIATHEAFIQAIDRIGRYREETSFANWLYGLTIDVTRRRYRRWKLEQQVQKLFGRRRGAVQATDAPVQSAAPAEGLSAGVSEAALWQSIRGMDERLRLPVVLRYYHDFPIAEIARILKISEGAVRARLDQAREKLAVTTKDSAA